MSERRTHHLRRVLDRSTPAAAATAGALLLTACGATAAPAPPTAAASASASPASSAPPSPAGTPPATVPVDVDGIGWGHVHNLAYDGDTLVLGTHGGLFLQQPGRAPELRSETGFDVMGLAYDGRRWLASGHPAPDDDLPADLGLRASADGRTWTTVSLLGEVDFHRLTASGATVLGVSAHDGALLRSQDEGASWTRLDNPGVFDVALDPSSPGRALATTENGPLLSTDAGTSWSPIAEAPLLAFVAFSAGTAYGVSLDGAAHVSADGGATWIRTGGIGARPEAFAAADGRVAVLGGGKVHESVDGGATFAPRLTGLDDH